MKRLFEHYLAACARQAVLRERPRVIAVAGSVGKTSTKEAIGIALGAHLPEFNVRMSPKNYNNELGVPLSIFHIHAPGRSPIQWLLLLIRAASFGLGFSKIGARTLVLEYAPDHPGDLAWLIGIARPDVAVLTAIAPEHTEFFGSLEGVAKEELTILRSLGPDGVAVLNADDARVMQGRTETHAPVVSYGTSSDATVRIVSSSFTFDEQDVAASGLDIQIVSLGKAVTVRARGVFGQPQALAIAAALAVVQVLDIDFHEAAERLSHFQGAAGRTRVIEGIKRTVLLDDSYNSSPHAALSAIADLASMPVREGSKRIAAMGDMLELGSLAESAHEEVGRAIAAAGIDVLVGCGTLAHVLIRAAKDAGMSEDRIFVFTKSEEVGLFLQERIHPGDVVLIKGSQGTHMEKVVKELMAHPENAKHLLVRQVGEWEGR